MAEVKRRVAYYYRGDVGNYYYGAGHPMKPVRMKLAHHLLLSYGLYRQLEVYRPHLATAEEMKEFHSSDYIDFLSRITPENMHEFAASMSKFGIGEFSDCPVFSGLYDYCRIHAGASIDGAVRLNHGHADVAINWSGGLHHAKKSEASGFCYVNDIVLAILELLKYHPRVLYVDIDIHHGDGVEEAFYTTDRVMTCSFHKFGDFFPGTGDIRHIGHAEGKHYAINFPLRSGIDDLSYEHVFKPVVAKIMEVYQPTAVVLQCGADSLTGDRLGSFNLTVKGHAECVKFVKSFGLPTLMVGGGGYTVRNVARAWCYETSVMLGTPVADAIPPSDYIEFFRPDYRLHLTPAAMPNQNTPEYLERCKVALLESLRGVAHAPSVPFQYVPPDWARLDDTDDDTRGLDPDVRISRPEGRRDAPGEYYNDDKDHDQPGDDAEEDDDDKDADDDVEGEDNERDTPMTHVGDGAASSSSEASRSRKRPRGESSPPPVAAAEAAAAATSAAATVVEAAASPVAPAAATVASAPDVVQVAPAAVSAGDSVDVKPKLDDEGNAAAQGAQADALSGAAVAASTAGTTSGDESTSKRSKLAAEAQHAAVEAAAPTAASGSAAEAKSEQLLLDASEMVGGAGVPARMTDGDKGDDEAETPAAAAPVAETQPIQAAAPAAAAAASQTAAAAPASEAAAGGAPAPTA